MKSYEHQYYGTNPRLFLHVIRSTENLSAAFRLGRNDAIVTFENRAHLRELREVVREAILGPHLGFGTSARFWLCPLADALDKYLLHIAPSGVQLTLMRDELKEMYEILCKHELTVELESK